MAGLAPSVPPAARQLRVSRRSDVALPSHIGWGPGPAFVYLLQRRLLNASRMIQTAFPPPAPAQPSLNCLFTLSSTSHSP